MGGYSCGSALDQMNRIVKALLAARAVTSSVVQPVRSWFEFCVSCDKRNSWSKCLGWQFRVPESKPLTLGPFLDKGTTVLIELSADLNFRRESAMNLQDWRTAPVEKANLTVSIRGGTKDVRYHVDLAELGQEGHVWHLQFGGKGSHVSEARLDLPRWPVAPLDFALLIDTILQNYNRSMWNRCWGNQSYKGSLVESDALMRSAWIGRMASVGTGSQLGVFNQVFDNRASSPWNPRPSGIAVARGR